jgi:hypothetical protein
MGMQIESGSTTCNDLVLGWEGHAASSCFMLMAAPGGWIRRRWLRARTVEVVRGLAKHLGGQGDLGSFPLPPPRSASGRIRRRWSTWRLAPRGDVRRPNLAGGGRIR